MKIGVVGKGGTGKTTLSGLIARACADRGQRVVAIDTDSNPNLGLSLGLDESAVATAPLLPRQLVVGEGGGMSPGDLLAGYGLATPAGVTLLHAMRVDEAGAGCTCSSHASVRSLLAATLEEHADVTLVDMEAGLEHLSRSGGTLAHVDVMLVVMEPTHKSLLTAARTIALAEELGIIRSRGVANKVRPEDAAFIEQMAPGSGVPLAGVVPYDPAVIDADRAGQPVQPSTQTQDAIRQVLGCVDSREEQKAALRAHKARLERRLAALGAG